MLRINWESQLTKRIIIGAGLLSVLAVVLALRQIHQHMWFVFDAVVILGVFFCLYEVMKAKKLKSKGIHDYYVYPYVIISYLIFLVGILVATPFSIWLHIVLQAVLIFILAVYVFLMAYTDKEFIKKCNLEKKPLGKATRTVVMQYLGLLIYPALLLYTLIPLNHMGRWASFEYMDYGLGMITRNAPMIGLFALLMVFIISAMTDTFCFITGKLLGGPKICPKISPNKTVTGFIGGLFGGVIGALVVILAMSANSGVAGFFTQRIGSAVAVNLFIVGIGLLGGFITQMGDWYASYVKRKSGIKDFGAILPGHGGLMDRFDGIAFNAFFIFFVMMIIVFAIPNTL
ncbi:MAG: phosphatidate cytidylyltransferase [Firmicutes bacterium]|nr:phosphatidate cytidylyltransferase [Bacillota bacterium]